MSGVSLIRYKNGGHTLTDFMGNEPTKKRKRRTSFTPQALEILNAHFERNTHPSGKYPDEVIKFILDKVNHFRNGKNRLYSISLFVCYRCRDYRHG